MSQDLARHAAQRGNNGASTYNSADDLWMQQQALAVAGPNGNGGAMTQGGEVQPLKVVHRSLRGRYKLAVLLAAVGASVGTVLGWTSYERSYRAGGLVRIQPDQINASGAKDNQISEYTRYMGSEANVVRSEDIARRAMGRPEWVKAAGPNAWQPAEFLQKLTTSYINSAQEIKVNFDNARPDVALAGVKATLAAYAEFRNEQRALAAKNSSDSLAGQKRVVQTEIDGLQAKITETQRANNKGNIEERSRIMGAALAQLEQQRNDEGFLVRQMEAVVQKFKSSPQPTNVNALAQKSVYLANVLNQRDQLRAAIISEEGALGPNNPKVVGMKARLASIDKNLTELVAAEAKGVYGYVDAPARGGAATGEVIEVNEATLANHRDKLAMLDSEIAARQKDVATLDDSRFTIAELMNQIETKRQLVKDFDAQLTRAYDRSQPVTLPFSVNADPSVSIQEDKRPTMATFGFVAGAGIPLLGLVAFGLMDRKYRYSDEATGSSGTRGVPLLGILPNLPDRLSDPSQASVAAHCVHQIRTMLQLNCLSDGPSVLAVTSATSGDGKTSLSLALGLSFAASGSRTLLIDTDLIGGGLSSRLGIREPHGISEAISTRDAMQFVRETDVADLSVLPVGADGPQNASAFSPTAVRRLVEEVRRHFDIVLIDTGPVLGSIEATPVVAASDATILTVARGQNKDLVEKALTHLRTIGARIAGVVFNRANASDFERSISGISLRSVSRASSATTGTNGHSTNGKHQDKRLGPLVHSVRGTRDEN